MVVASVITLQSSSSTCIVVKISVFMYAMIFNVYRVFQSSTPQRLINKLTPFTITIFFISPFCLHLLTVTKDYTLL